MPSQTTAGMRQKIKALEEEQAVKLEKLAEIKEIIDDAEGDAQDQALTLENPRRQGELTAIRSDLQLDLLSFMASELVSALDLLDAGRPGFLMFDDNFQRAMLWAHAIDRQVIEARKVRGMAIDPDNAYLERRKQSVVKL